MRKTVKRWLIVVLGLLFTGAIFSACTNGENSSSPTLDNLPFSDFYEAEYGEVYYFETLIFNGKPLEYIVSQNGNSVTVKNNGFLVSSLDEYQIDVKYVGGKEILDSFEIKAKDNGAPNIAFSYQEKIVLEGSIVTLPEIFVSDNQDKNVKYTAKLMQGNEEISISDNTFEAVKGEYQYNVSATDASGNTTEKTCLIMAGGKLDVAKAVNWTNPNSDVEYCREISGGTMEVSDEIVYGGFKTSFKVTINNPVAETCLTVKNALIEDISEYDYFLVYMYNDMTSSRQCSVNWSSKHVRVLNQGEWVPIIYPINENLVSDSNNDIYQMQQDWKNCNGLRFYIQNAGTATGSVYLTDIFLLDVPDKNEFIDDLSALELLTASDEWQSAYNLVNAEYNVLQASDSSIDLNDALGRTNAKYSQLVLGEDYDDNILAYGDDRLKISQIVGFGDQWGLPEKIERNTDVKYGDESGSFEVTFRLDRNRVLTKVTNASVYKKSPMGEVVFMIKNATNSEFKIYTDLTADTGVWTVKVSDEWQEVRLAVTTTNPIQSIGIYVYTLDEELVKPLDDGTAKIYYSNIRYIPYEQSGTYFPMTEGYVNTFAKKWAGNEEISFVEDEEKQYNGHGVMSVSLSELLMGGTYGFYLNRNKLAALLEKGGVKLTVTYNVTNVSHVGKYIGFYGTQTAVADKSEGWHQVTTLFTSMPEHFIFAVGSAGDFAWEGVGIIGEMLIADISYEYAEPPEFTVGASTSQWQNPSSVSQTNEYVFGEEAESSKVGFQAGYKYANIIIKSYVAIDTGYIEFYFKNTTGCELELYIAPEEIIQINDSDEWQLVRLAVDPEKTTYELLVRGKNEAVVNETEVTYYYISTVRVG